MAEVRRCLRGHTRVMGVRCLACQRLRKQVSRWHLAREAVLARRAAKSAACRAAGLRSWAVRKG